MGKSILIVSAMMLLMACEERKLVVKTQPLPTQRIPRHQSVLTL